MKWKIATAIICCFGVFKDFRPSESYLTSYLTNEDMKNLSSSAIKSEVYPVWTYSYLATLVIVLLVTDYLRYKIVIIFEAIAYIVTWILLLFGQNIFQMQLMQVAYGSATSTEIGYYSYIYSAVSEENYRRVSSFVRGSSLTGRFLAAVLGQILVISGVNYFQLNIISTVNVCIAFVISIFLPKVEKSFYFDKSAENNETTQECGGSVAYIEEDADGHNKDVTHHKSKFIRISFKEGLTKMARDFTKAYSHTQILIWSFWWAMDTCGNLQLGNYIQYMWIEISPNRTHTNNYNGAVDATSMALNFRPSDSFITAYLMDPKWKNLTAEQVNNEVYPVWVYSHLVCLLVILLVTDFLRYKIVIVMAALCYVSTWILLLFGQGLPLMQLMQGFFGFATASQVAHTSYVFASVNQKYYKKLSSYIHSSSLASRFVAASLSQILISFTGTNYFHLNIISTVSVTIATVISLFLPSVTPYYFISNTKSPSKNTRLKNSERKIINEEETQKLSCDNSKDITQNDITSSQLESKLPDISVKFLNESNLELLIPKNKDDLNHCPQSSLVESIDLLNETSINASNLEIIIPKNKDNSNHCPQSSPVETIDLVSDTSINTSNHTEFKTSENKKPCLETLDSGLRKMCTDFVKAYRNQTNLTWSFWWVIVVCGKTHIGNYIQSLYEEILPNPVGSMSYNAATDAVALLTCAVASFGVGFVKINWNNYENTLLFSVNLIIAGLMIGIALTTKIWVAYVCYIIIRICYNTVLTIATYQIATFLNTQSYALVFGFNTFLALALETILTIVVVDKRGLNLDIRTQFLVYGGYFGVLALPFFARIFYCFFSHRQKKQLGGENLQKK